MKKKIFKYTLKKSSYKLQKKYKLRYGNYGIKTLTQGLLGQKNLENIRRKLSKQFKKQAYVNKFKIFIRCTIWKPYTAKPLLSRMGKGAGPITRWFTWIKQGFILIEILSTLPYFIVKNIVKRATKLFPLKLILIKILH